MWVKKFAEFALSGTFFEIQAFENSKWLPFLEGQKFFENWVSYEIALSSTVFKIQAFLKKIRKFKMAAIFGK